MKSSYNGIPVPSDGEVVQYQNGRYLVPDRPIVPFIEGDGSGRDIWKAARAVLDAGVAKAYSGKRSIAWFEVLAGEKAFLQTGDWLPSETVDATRDFRVSIKGPLTTPIGGGIRSLNVALRQTLDLYQCVRPVRHFAGVPSPVTHPDDMDIVIFRENTEDIYAGIEVKEGTPEAAKFIKYVNTEILKDSSKQLREDSGVGLKPISRHGSKRLVRSAIQYALDHGRKVVTIVHKGNIQKFTEGAFREWGYEVATTEFRAQVVTEREKWILEAHDKSSDASAEEIALTVEPGLKAAPEQHRVKMIAEVAAILTALGATHGNGKWKDRIVVNDRIADATFQELLIRPTDYSIIATTNLNGDYLSDAAAAQVGGLGIAPGMNIGDGYAVFEATHGTAPSLADRNIANPGSVILSGCLLLQFLGWGEAAQMIEDAMEEAIRQRFVTADFFRLMKDATLAGTSEFGARIIENLRAQ